MGNSIKMDLLDEFIYKKIWFLFWKIDLMIWIFSVNQDDFAEDLFSVTRKKQINIKFELFMLRKIKINIVLFQNLWLINEKK